MNIAGWTFIVWRKPFGVGDRIEIGEHAGDVIDLRIFQFTILEIGNWVDGDQSTGRIIHIPNGKVFNETPANYSKGFQYIWNEVPVMITIFVHPVVAAAFSSLYGRIFCRNLADIRI